MIFTTMTPAYALPEGMGIGDPDKWRGAPFRNDRGDVVGRVTKAWVEDESLVMAVQIDEKEHPALVKEVLAGRLPDSFSMGHLLDDVVISWQAMEQMVAGWGLEHARADKISLVEPAQDDRRSYEQLKAEALEGLEFRRGEEYFYSDVGDAFFGGLYTGVKIGKTLSRGAHARATQRLLHRAQHDIWMQLKPLLSHDPAVSARAKAITLRPVGTPVFSDEE